MHQLYANEENWKIYTKQMSHYLPLLLRRYLLNKERQNALKILTRNQVLTRKHAKELLLDCLHAIFMKMSGGKNNINHIIEINKNDSNKKDKKVEYFFGQQPTSLDAVLCSEIVILECCQLPNKYLNDIKDDPKIKHLLKYSKRIMEYYHESILKKLSSDNDIQITLPLKQPIDFNKIKQNKKKYDKSQQPQFYTKYFDTEEKRNSMLFVVGSFAAFALYWKFFQPKS